MSFWSSRVETSAAVTWRLIVRVFWRVLILAGLVYAGYRLRGLIVTLCVSAVIAYMLDPSVEWLCHRRWFTQFHYDLFALFAKMRPRFGPPRAPRPAYCKHHTIRLCAASYVFVIAFLLFWQGGLLVIKPFASEIRKMTSTEGRREMTRKRDHFLRWYDRTVPDWMQSSKIQSQIQNIDFSEPMNAAASEVVRGVAESAKGIVEIVLIPVLAFYVLVDGRRLKHELVGTVPRAKRRDAVRVLNDFNRIMRAYISGQFILCFLAGVIVGIWLVLLHMKYPLILAVFAGLTRAIPVVGPIFGAIPILILVFAEGMGWPTAVAFIVFFSTLHLIETKFIMPLLIGDRIDLHPVIIIVVLLIGGEAGALLLGSQLGALLGMFFAAPLSALLRVLVRRYWLGLPPRPPRRPASVPQETPAVIAVPETGK
ncbi:MAG TPA: AI-2E family transporter [Chthonomonadaceae bacterium]|nr:AI-2E family transporter [Chthonomonadaceae bacterium]